jgi:H+/Cl- antiporter ClcA
VTLTTRDVVWAGVIVAVFGAVLVNLWRLEGLSDDHERRRKMTIAWTAVWIGCGLILLGLFRQ